MVGSFFLLATRPPWRGSTLGGVMASAENNRARLGRGFGTLSMVPVCRPSISCSIAHKVDSFFSPSSTVISRSRQRGTSPREGHDYDEIIVVTEGTIELERSDRKEVGTHSKFETIFLPRSTVHQITIKQAPMKLVIIHPDRGA